MSIPFFLFIYFEKGFQVSEKEIKRQKRAHRKLGGFFFSTPLKKKIYTRKKGAVRLPQRASYYTAPTH